MARLGEGPEPLLRPAEHNFQHRHEPVILRVAGTRPGQHREPHGIARQFQPELPVEPQFPAPLGHLQGPALHVPERHARRGGGALHAGEQAPLPRRIHGLEGLREDEPAPFRPSVGLQPERADELQGAAGQNSRPGLGQPGRHLQRHLRMAAWHPHVGRKHPGQQHQHPAHRQSERQARPGETLQPQQVPEGDEPALLGYERQERSKQEEAGEAERGGGEEETPRTGAGRAQAGRGRSSRRGRARGLHTGQEEPVARRQTDERQGAEPAEGGCQKAEGVCPGDYALPRLAAEDHPQSEELSHPRQCARHLGPRIQGQVPQGGREYTRHQAPPQGHHADSPERNRPEASRGDEGLLPAAGGGPAGHVAP